MTPKEKAWNLYHTYRTLEGKFGDKVLYNYSAKQCALIAVDLIIYHTEEDSSNIPLYEYYSEVKQEINKL
jgi:hypothetical protein